MLNDGPTVPYRGEAMTKTIAPSLSLSLRPVARVGRPERALEHHGLIDVISFLRAGKKEASRHSAG